MATFIQVDERAVVLAFLLALLLAWILRPEAVESAFMLPVEAVRDSGLLYVHAGVGV